MINPNDADRCTTVLDLKGVTLAIATKADIILFIKQAVTMMSTHYPEVWFGVVFFGSVWFALLCFGSVRFGSVRFGSVRVGFELGLKLGCFFFNSFFFVWFWCGPCCFLFVVRFGFGSVGLGSV